MANSFTPQQIEEFLREFFDVVGARQYVGARYVPIFGRAGEDTVEWDDLAPYEPLTVVMHDGISYVSRRYVPRGIQITDTAYWVETYRFNAQVEQYRQEVLTFSERIDGAYAAVEELRFDAESDYVPFPDPEQYAKYGTAGQVLSTLANGETMWQDPVVPSDAQAEEVITSWLDDHPEATTTVQDDSLTTAKYQDGSVTDAKLDPNGILATLARYEGFSSSMGGVGAATYNEWNWHAPIFEGYSLDGSTGAFNVNADYSVLVLPVRTYDADYRVFSPNSTRTVFQALSFRLCAYDANMTFNAAQSKSSNNTDPVRFTDHAVKYFAIHFPRTTMTDNEYGLLVTTHLTSNNSVPITTVYADQTSAIRAHMADAATSATSAGSSGHADTADNATPGTTVNSSLVPNLPNNIDNVRVENLFTITPSEVTYSDTYQSQRHNATLVYPLGLRSAIEGMTIVVRYAASYDTDFGLTLSDLGTWGGGTKWTKLGDIGTNGYVAVRVTASVLDQQSYADSDGTIKLTFRLRQAWQVTSNLLARLNVSVIPPQGLGVVYANHLADTIVDEINAAAPINRLLDGTTWAAYGDSITAISNGNGLSLGWAAYVNDNIGFTNFYGRGVGGQGYAWGTGGGSATFVYADGRYQGRNDSYTKDNYAGEVPEGTTLVRGCFCSWDRITHMFPASIKDSIGVVFVMGGTNDTYDATPAAFVASSTVDPEWAASSQYSTYGGDYDVSTLAGGMASCVMKLQAWMPDAVIVIGTELSGGGTSGQVGTALDTDAYRRSRIEADMGHMLSCPVIDVYATCGINPLNRLDYISDGVHPYLEAGKMMLGRAVLMGMRDIVPMLGLRS